MANKTQKPLKQLKEIIGKNKRDFYPYTIPEAVLNEDDTTLADTLEALPSTYIQQSEKEKANGVATLGTDGKIPESQMPQEYVESKGNCLTKQEASKTYLTQKTAETDYLKKDVAEKTYAKKDDIPASPNLSEYITSKYAEDTYLKIKNASKAEKSEINGNIRINGTETNVYTLPKATDTTLGGIKTGYMENGKNYPVKIDTNGNAYVNVPLTSGDGGDSGQNSFSIVPQDIFISMSGTGDGSMYHSPCSAQTLEQNIKKSSIDLHFAASGNYSFITNMQDLSNITIHITPMTTSSNITILFKVTKWENVLIYCPYSNVELQFLQPETTGSLLNVSVFTYGNITFYLTGNNASTTTYWRGGFIRCGSMSTSSQTTYLPTFEDMDIEIYTGDEFAHQTFMIGGFYCTNCNVYIDIRKTHTPTSEFNKFHCIFYNCNVYINCVGLRMSNDPITVSKYGGTFAWFPNNDTYINSGSANYL